MASNLISLLWVFVGIVLLIFLIIKVKVHNIVALLLSALFIAFAEGMKITQIVPVIQKGLGGLLGTLALIVIFGAIIGKLMTESGASQQIADTIVNKMGRRMLPFALLIIGTIFGMAMFYEVAFLITIPLVISMLKKQKYHI